MKLKNLIALRSALGYNQKEFAEQLGIKQTTYNGYENGIRDPGIDFLAKIATRYGVTTDYLAGLTDDFDLGNTKKSPSPEDESITSESMEVARAYNKAEQKNKNIVRLALNLPLVSVDAPKRKKLSALDEYIAHPPIIMSAGAFGGDSVMEEVSEEEDARRDKILEEYQKDR